MAKKPGGRRKKAGTSPSDLLGQIQKGDIRPLYFLHGNEDLEREEVLSSLISATVEPATQDFNLDVLRADESDVSDIVNRATAFPMMASRRAVVVRQLERLLESDAQALLPLVQNPPETTVLVFTATKFDGRRKLFLELRKSAVCVAFPDPYDREVPDWIQRRARALGKQIEPEAVHLLHLSVGPHPRELANELEKLAIHVGDRDRVTGDDVTRVVAASTGDTIFKLTDAVGEGQVAEAQALLNRLLEQGENAVGIVAMLSRHIGLLRRARWMLEARVPRQEMARHLKVPPFFVSGYLKQAGRYSDTGMEDAHEALLAADYRLKSGGRRSQRATLAVLVHALCNADATATAQA